MPDQCVANTVCSGNYCIGNTGYDEHSKWWNSDFKLLYTFLSVLFMYLFSVYLIIYLLNICLYIYFNTINN